MLKKGFSLIFLLFIAFIQVTILKRIELYGVQPDILLLSAVFFALLPKERGKIDSLIFALLAGLLKDIFSEDILGINASSFVILILLIEHYRQKIYIEHFSACSLVSFFSAFFVSLFYYFTHYRLLPPFFNSLRCIILPSSIYTALFAIPYFYLLKSFRLQASSYKQETTS